MRISLRRDQVEAMRDMAREWDARFESVEKRATTDGYGDRRFAATLARGRTQEIIALLDAALEKEGVGR